MNIRQSAGLRIAAIMATVLLGARNSAAQSSVAVVNPFIGTANGGNTFPGAVVPWGMVSVSPHTTLRSPSGYIHHQPHFYGFGHVQLSGTGCADLGSIRVTALRSPAQPEPELCRTSYADEIAEPGYYRVRLPDIGMTAEATAATRCGVSRWTTERDGVLTLQIDAGRSLGLVGGGHVRILSADSVEGWNIAGGFCGEANRHTVYFAARLSMPARVSGTWRGSVVGRTITAEARDTTVGAWMEFNLSAGTSLIVRIGISYVSTANAWSNLDGEAGDIDFADLRRHAAGEWKRCLDRVRVEGGTHDDSVKFYTALYHALIHPSVISDRNGDYPLMGHRGVGNVQGRERYSVFSLWDTYRTLHPLLTLVYPERQSAIIKSMLDMSRESGWLPKWELISNETYMMAGDPAAIVIADSYVNGITDFDGVEAYEAMRRPSDRTTRDDAPPIRAGYHEYLRLGYIPADQDTTEEWWVWGPASTTLEYCLADWSISRMAAALGRKEDAAEFGLRSLFYRNLFDSTTQFIRPRLRDGRWLSPFDPLRTEGSGSWEGSGGPGYVEGNAWNYTWFVPHDIKGLAERFGGNAGCAEKLAESFTNGQFTVTNEPDLAYPYLFTELPGEEARTAPLVRSLMQDKFGTGPDGLPGNDDAGTISSWFIFSALGFYPSCPASGTYQLGLPLFPRVTIRLNPAYYADSSFTVERTGRVRERVKIGSIKVNGEPRSEFCISHREITRGGVLKFDLAP